MKNDTENNKAGFDFAQPPVRIQLDTISNSISYYFYSTQLLHTTFLGH